MSCNRSKASAPESCAIVLSMIRLSPVISMLRRETSSLERIACLTTGASESPACADWTLGSAAAFLLCSSASSPPSAISSWAVLLRCCCRRGTTASRGPSTVGCEAPGAASWAFASDPRCAFAATSPVFSMMAASPLAAGALTFANEGFEAGPNATTMGASGSAGRAQMTLPPSSSELTTNCGAAVFCSLEGLLSALKVHSTTTEGPQPMTLSRGLPSPLAASTAANRAVWILS
mmetsp:Transcript_25845/g.74719  ORF Transcript_25845/g.74719 Transcript_25845/m.74719 type:complete len:234 (+) Transcript_25845:510-1211(+)